MLASQESTRLPYGLVRRAVAWGWPETRVLVIDADLGRSGTSVEGHHGLQRLGAAMGLDQVGVILGVEMSRTVGDLSPVWDTDRGARLIAEC